MTRYQDAAPVAGVVVRFGTTEAVTNHQGRFTISQAPRSGPVRLTAAAPGYLDRAVWRTIAEPAGHVQFDMIESAEPFSLAYYRAFARNGYEQPESLATLRQWTVSPSFYLKTTLQDAEGEELPSDVLGQIEEIFVKSVPALSGGRFEVAALERGTTERPIIDGWVNVLFYRQLQSGLGSATVGGNQGVIRLTFAPELEAVPPCENVTLSLANHEIVHAMGFWHTGADWFPEPWRENTFRTADCRGTRPALVKYHAAVAYSRPRLNRDEDIDPAALALTAAGASHDGAGSLPEVFCRVH